MLLDTVCWLWMQASPERFSEASLALLEAADSELVLSAASSWEIAIKHALGKLTLPEDPETYVPSRLRSSGVLPLPVHHGHALHVATLPRHHDDPFDRLLIAQARIEDLAVLTADDVFTLYDVAVVKA